MRLKTFTTWERMELIPMELVAALKAGLIIIPIFFLLAFLGNSGGVWTNALSHGLFSVLAILTAILAGCCFNTFIAAMAAGPGLFGQRSQSGDSFRCRSYWLFTGVTGSQG